MTVESAADQALALKKRARRRLVGAIALVLLMLIVLPNVLKDRAQVEQRAPITLTMPEDMQATPEAAVPKIVEPAQKQSAETVDSPAAELANPPAQPKHQPAPPVASSPAALPAPQADGTKSHSQPSNQIAISQTPSAHESAPANDAKNTHYLIQVGVFSDMENVKKLQTKISEAGFSSRTAKLSTPKGEKIRLRVGTFVTRDAAAEALRKLEAQGLTGMVLLDE